MKKKTMRILLCVMMMAVMFTGFRLGGRMIMEIIFGAEKLGVPFEQRYAGRAAKAAWR